MRWGLLRTGAAVVAVAVVLVGCSSKQGGTATPGPTGGGASGTQQPLPTSGVNPAPKIDNPLDATPFLTQPCAVLSPAQLKAFNITKPGEPHTDDPVARDSGPYCTWHTDDQPVSRTYGVGYLTGNKRGLADTIRGGSKAFPGYFEPTEVEGYPAVFNEQADGRAGGACNITVGISDTQAFRAAEQADRARGVRSCDGAKQFAAAVIEGLKRGA